MKNLINKLLKLDFAKFIVVGGCSTLLDFIVYMVLSKWINITIAKCISMLCASVFSYFINKNWTFENKDKTDIVYLVKYYIAFAINLGTNVGINTLVFNTTGMKIVAFILATGVAMVVNFLLQRFFVFKGKKQGSNCSSFE